MHRDRPIFVLGKGLSEACEGTSLAHMSCLKLSSTTVVFVGLIVVTERRSCVRHFVDRPTKDAKVPRI